MSSAPVPLSLSPAGRRLVGYVLRGAAILGVIIGLDTFLLHLRLDPLADMRAYYDAGARLNAGIPLYEQPAETDDAEFYRYPPLLAIAFRPLAMLPFEAAAGIWAVILLACFLATIFRLGPRDRWTWLLLGYLAAPIGWSLAIGQAHVVVTALLAVASPWAVALAANLKILPGLAAAWWIGRRDWRALRSFAMWMVVLAVVQLALEPAGTIAFLTFTDLAQIGDVQNRSLYAISPFLWAGSVIVLALVALRLANTRYGWAAAIALSVLATPRLLLYQLMALLAAARRPRPGMLE